MSRRKDRGRTPGLWIATNELPATGGHPFYQRLNHFLDAHGFDDFVEAQCAPFYAATVGRPSVMPGTYFRLRLIGYFEGIDSERGIAWRTADSLALRGFLGLGLDQMSPEHSTISRTRRLIDLETHRAVFTWILQVLATADLVTGKTIGIDATTLEANAALRSIVRRDSGETYQEFLTRLAQASGIETPTRADVLQRRRSERLERPNAHLYETGRMRRTHLRGHANILKRLVVHIGGFNLGLLMRSLVGIGTPRSLQGRLAAVVAVVMVLWTRVKGRWRDHGTPSADHPSVFTPHHDFELLPVGSSESDLRPRAARREPKAARTVTSGPTCQGYPLFTPVIRTSCQALVLQRDREMALPDVLLLIGVAMVVYYGRILARTGRRRDG